MNHSVRSHPAVRSHPGWRYWLSDPRLSSYQRILGDLISFLRQILNETISRSNYNCICNAMLWRQVAIVPLKYDVRYAWSHPGENRKKRKNKTNVLAVLCLSTGPDGFNFIKMFTRVVSRLRINSLNNIYEQLMSHIRQVLKVCFCTLVVQIGCPRNLWKLNHFTT